MVLFVPDECRSKLVHDRICDCALGEQGDVLHCDDVCYGVVVMLGGASQPKVCMISGGSVCNFLVRPPSIITPTLTHSGRRVKL